MSLTEAEQGTIHKEANAIRQWQSTIAHEIFLRELIGLKTYYTGQIGMDAHRDAAMANRLAALDDLTTQLEGVIAKEVEAIELAAQDEADLDRKPSENVNSIRSLPQPVQ